MIRHSHELGAPCSACLGPNESLSDLLSEIIDILADEIDRSAEICATEELSFHLEAANKMLVELDEQPITIGSLDVVSMFPNLKACFVSKMIMQAMLTSNLEFQGFDYQRIGIYLALVVSKTEFGLSKYVPESVVKKVGKSKIKISSQVEIDQYQYNRYRYRYRYRFDRRYICIGISLK